MKAFVVTDVHIVARLYRSGILKYFNEDELIFYITDFCYYEKVIAINNDKIIAKKMIEEGLLKVVELNSNEVEEVSKLHKSYKPKFVAKTISALVYATRNELVLISEDELLRDTASELGIRAYDKEWLIITMVHEISTMGINIDLNMVKEII